MVLEAMAAQPSALKAGLFLFPGDGAEEEKRRRGGGQLAPRRGGGALPGVTPQKMLRCCR